MLFLRGGAPQNAKNPKNRNKNKEKLKKIEKNVFFEKIAIKVKKNQKN